MPHIYYCFAVSIVQWGLRIKNLKIRRLVLLKYFLIDKITQNKEALTYARKKKILSPKLDVIFQALFGEIGSETI